jgi:hypothetical protein
MHIGKGLWPGAELLRVGASPELKYHCCLWGHEKKSTRPMIRQQDSLDRLLGGINSNTVDTANVTATIKLEY